ncbi:MAG: hypothetical protein U0401_04570 [Anaerolineae bacterium]
MRSGARPYTSAITVNQGDNPPVAEAGGPYSGKYQAPPCWMAAPPPTPI